MQKIVYRLHFKLCYIKNVENVLTVSPVFRGTTHE